MTNTVISIGSFRDVHDINVITTKGRHCTIDIYKNDNGFDSEVTVLDGVSKHSGSWVYKINSATTSATDNFNAAIEFIKNYLSQVDPQDMIKDIHNPCSTPFVSEADQNNVLSTQGISISVRVN